MSFWAFLDLLLHLIAIQIRADELEKSYCKIIIINYIFSFTNDIDQV